MAILLSCCLVLMLISSVLGKQLFMSNVWVKVKVFPMLSLIIVNCSTYINIVILLENSSASMEQMNGPGQQDDVELDEENSTSETLNVFKVSSQKKQMNGDKKQTMKQGDQSPSIVRPHHSAGAYFPSHFCYLYYSQWRLRLSISISISTCCALLCDLISSNSLCWRKTRIYCAFMFFSFAFDID